MELFKVVGILGAILYGVYVMLRRARVDKTLAELNRKDRSEEDKEIGKLTQEVEDAKIRYNNSRREFDQSDNSGGGS